MTIQTTTISNVLRAQKVVHQHLCPAPLIRSHAIEKELGLAADRRVWIKDYGWTPVGSFKLMGALNWMDYHATRIGNQPVIAHSSGNFASGLAFAGMRYQKRVILVMPNTAPKIKTDLTLSLGAEIHPYDIAADHLTGERDRLVDEFSQTLGAIQASPYDDREVIAGNGVGGLEIVDELKRLDRTVSHFICPVSGGGLMAGHALAIANGYPECNIIGVEPDKADDFRQSLLRGSRVRLERPESICDGLLSYDVGQTNWPILQQHVSQAVTASDLQTRQAMRWLYDRHGLKTEPSGSIALAAVLSRKVSLDQGRDLVIILSGRNCDETAFRNWIEVQ
ncbi:threonine/serine dehydratase [Pirellulaceae bacterium]|jgi:threonine dehydratase|nr:threonine/serine dehydratase [Pirellulaceae bacterium]